MKTVGLKLSNTMKILPQFVLCFLLLASLSPAKAQSDSEYPNRVIGDIGVGIYASKTNLQGQGTETSVLPYGFFDYQRFFMRIDTLGVKLFSAGYGHIELAGRVNADSQFIKINPSGNSITKNTPAPIGFGSLQITPVGAFYLNAFHDFGSSQGNLLEGLYFAELSTKYFTIYPQAGIEYLSGKYANYYFGLSPAEAATLGSSSYTARATTNTMLGAMVEIPLSHHWILNVYGKHKWLGNEINGSPVLSQKHQDLFFMALAYRFK